MHDGLTNLSNRTCFMERLTQVLDQKPPAGNLAVLFLDCDRFKVINDSLGHAAGDQVLRAIANRLQPLLSQVTLLSRFGGDEFTILMSDLADPAQAVTVAETILAAMQDPFVLGSRHLFLGASIGIAYNQSNDCQPEELLRDADIAMYRAKAAGKGCYCIFEPTMHDTARARLQLETDLRIAIDRQEFQLRYQPIINLTTGILAGFEVLLRWHHPQKGVINPALFLEVAEETGLITQIDQQTLAKACRQLRQWQQDGVVDPSVTISVNLSAQQFGQPGLVALVDDLLQAADLPAKNLNLEVTETSILTDVALTQTVLRTLQARQIGISIDDFGTGYSSLSYLHAFCFDTLKIDQSFVQSMTPTAPSTGLIPLILSVAKTLNSAVVAEGIEHAYQLEQLKALGCDYGQGYYLSRPLAPEAIPAFVAAGNHLTPSPTALSQS
jgi:diguanylate cyclase (GGDEF)-like protein